jgi:hypothetical protein
MTRKLILEDIADLRAYEREREEFRDRVIALKKTRRVGIGPFITLVFENRDTIRFQIQEMARAERMLSDEQIQTQLDTYNPLIPQPGELSATLFIELTAEPELREWLPKLVGVERSVELRLHDGDVIRAVPEAAHAAQLTREAITASVHYIHFQLAHDQIERFATGTVVLAVTHPSYRHEATISEATRSALLEDLREA